MAFINVFVGNSAKISTNKNQLEIVGEIKETFPIEDINSLMIESRQCVITSHTLNELAKNNVAVFVCNEFHMPAGIFLPFNQHYNNFKLFNIQNEAPRPLIKNLWREIIIGKICNQSAVLNCSTGESLERFYTNVLSGDSTNQEAAASSVYFVKLFGKEFSRNKDNIINACLNYGYTIIRGMIARTIVAHGLLPFIGIHHANNLNSFNLADDLMEPFRPIIDLYVKQNINSLVDSEFTSNIKCQIYNLINADIIINGQTHPVSYAIEVFICSFIDSLSSNNINIFLPKIISLNMHEYE